MCRVARTEWSMSPLIVRGLGQGQHSGLSVWSFNFVGRSLNGVAQWFCVGVVATSRCTLLSNLECVGTQIKGLVTLICWVLPVMSRVCSVLGNSKVHSLGKGDAKFTLCGY